MLTKSSFLSICLFFFLKFQFCVCVHAEELHYPPRLERLKGRIDFAGERFLVVDRARRLSGLKAPSPLMKKNVMILYERRNYHQRIARPRDMYLVKLKRGMNSGSPTDSFQIILNDGDTLIRKVRTLNDLRGFVKIRTETDALEFVRLGSSVLGGRQFEERIQEVFCIRVEDTGKIDDLVTWGTVDECRRVGFAPPNIINLSPTRRSHTDKGKDKNDEDEKGRDQEDDGPFFHITRIVFSSKDKIHEFLRLTEEVGPAGQWRIVFRQSLGPPNVENDLFMGIDRRPENRNHTLTPQEIEEYRESLGIPKQ